MSPYTNPPSKVVFVGKAEGVLERLQPFAHRQLAWSNSTGTHHRHVHCIKQRGEVAQCAKHYYLVQKLKIDNGVPI